jgi:hypothetical protein
VVQPQHYTLDKPVRAIVAPIMDDSASKRLQEVFERFWGPLVSPTGMWPQNSNLYHFTVWHASPHQVRITEVFAFFLSERQVARFNSMSHMHHNLTVSYTLVVSALATVTAWGTQGNTSGRSSSSYSMQDFREYSVIGSREIE